ncbi:IS3 family transposase [Loigolactobacillus binensis]|uniref:IS3 family transposase n=1 Tax=Loigolactobacillus binensis TaxID=2559922 RepID=A0ABW3EBL6_9LACO|nr:IS3 family transposase [Loigolactobacillus binensis]
MCQYVGVSRAVYYKWTHRKVTAHELENEAILAYIIEREESKNYIYGVHTMTMYLNEETSYHVSRGRVRRIMRRNGIRPSIRVAKRDRKAEKKECILANKLLCADSSHDFAPERPNMTWVTDFVASRGSDQISSNDYV